MLHCLSQLNFCYQNEPNSLLSVISIDKLGLLSFSHYHIYIILSYILTAKLKFTSQVIFLEVL